MDIDEFMRKELEDLESEEGLKRSNELFKEMNEDTEKTGNILIDTPIYCVMCKKNRSVAIAPKTNEPLCEKCNELNKSAIRNKR